MTEAVQAMVGTLFGSIMVVSVLTCCALLHAICALKATQMNVKCSLIWELMLYKIKMGHNLAETTKNIWAKGEGIVDHNKVTRWCENLDD